MNTLKFITDMDKININKMLSPRECTEILKQYGYKNAMDYWYKIFNLNLEDNPIPDGDFNFGAAYEYAKFIYNQVEWEE